MAIAMMVAALDTVVVWRYVLKFSGSLYEVFPGMLVGFVVYSVCRLVEGPHSSLNIIESKDELE